MPSEPIIRPVALASQPRAPDEIDDVILPLGPHTVIKRLDIIPRKIRGALVARLPERIGARTPKCYPVH